MKYLIEAAWENRYLLEKKETKSAIIEVINQLDNGFLRVAEKTKNGWKINEWIKKAVILYFPIQKMRSIEVGPFEFHDKIPLKKGFEKKKYTCGAPCDNKTWGICGRRYNFNAKLY